jgi:hypothetical protein
MADAKAAKQGGLSGAIGNFFFNEEKAKQFTKSVNKEIFEEDLGGLPGMILDGGKWILEQAAIKVGQAGIIVYNGKVKMLDPSAKRLMQMRMQTHLWDPLRQITGPHNVRDVTVYPRGTTYYSMDIRNSVRRFAGQEDAALPVQLKFKELFGDKGVADGNYEKSYKAIHAAGKDPYAETANLAKVVLDRAFKAANLGGVIDNKNDFRYPEYEILLRYVTDILIKVFEVEKGNDVLLATDDYKQAPVDLAIANHLNKELNKTEVIQRSNSDVTINFSKIWSSKDIFDSQYPRVVRNSFQNFAMEFSKIKTPFVMSLQNWPTVSGPTPIGDIAEKLGVINGEFDDKKATEKPAPYFQSQVWPGIEAAILADPAMANLMAGMNANGKYMIQRALQQYMYQLFLETVDPRGGLRKHYLGNPTAKPAALVDKVNAAGSIAGSTREQVVKSTDIKKSADTDIVKELGVLSKDAAAGLSKILKAMGVEYNKRDKMKSSLDTTPERYDFLGVPKNLVRLDYATLFKGLGERIKTIKDVQKQIAEIESKKGGPTSETKELRVMVAEIKRLMRLYAVDFLSQLFATQPIPYKVFDKQRKVQREMRYQLDTDKYDRKKVTEIMGNVFDSHLLSALDLNKPPLDANKALEMQRAISELKQLGLPADAPVIVSFAKDVLGVPLHLVGKTEPESAMGGLIQDDKKNLVKVQERKDTPPPVYLASIYAFTEGGYGVTNQEMRQIVDEIGLAATQTPPDVAKVEAAVTKLISKFDDKDPRHKAARAQFLRTMAGEVTGVLNDYSKAINDILRPVPIGSPPGTLGVPIPEVAIIENLNSKLVSDPDSQDAADALVQIFGVLTQIKVLDRYVRNAAKPSGGGGKKTPQIKLLSGFSDHAKARLGDVMATDALLSVDQRNAFNDGMKKAMKGATPAEKVDGIHQILKVASSTFPEKLANEMIDRLQEIFPSALVEQALLNLTTSTNDFLGYRAAGAAIAPHIRLMALIPGTKGIYDNYDQAFKDAKQAVADRASGNPTRVAAGTAAIAANRVAWKAALNAVLADPKYDSLEKIQTVSAEITEGTQQLTTGQKLLSGFTTANVTVQTNINNMNQRAARASTIKQHLEEIQKTFTEAKAIEAAI